MCDKFRLLNIILFMHGTIHFYWKLYLKKSFTSMITFHPSMDIGRLGVFNFIDEQFSIQMVYFIIDVYSKVSVMSSIFFPLFWFLPLILISCCSFFCLFFFSPSSFSYLPSTLSLIFSLLISKQFMPCSLMFPCNFLNHDFSHFISPKLFHFNIDNLDMKHVSFYIQPGWTTTYTPVPSPSWVRPLRAKP
jgi:hypothetical protein